VGKDQEVLLHMGITEPLENVGQGWVGLSVTIERPDGQTDTIPDIKTDSTGGTGKSYTPNMVGSYYLQTHFPAQWKNFSGYALYFEVGVSPVLELIVQDEPIPYYPGVTLPTEYWTRPIDAQFHEWSRIAGNWLAINSQFTESLAGSIAYNNEEAPETPHILWSKPLVHGGLAVSDDDMSAWMMYVYKQLTPRPENVTGVPVKLAYLLPDGTWKDIDETTSDNYGNFGYRWTPPDEGTYLVKAFFLGSKSYYGSQATTYVGVDPAEHVPSAQEIASTTVNQMPAYPTIPEIPAYLTIDLIILIIAIVVLVIGLLAYMALRKQK
jgi:hypothetical protein